MRFLVKSACRMAPWTPGGSLWIILNTLNLLVRLLRTFTNIKSWSAVQMKRFKTIRDDQMAKK